MTIYYKYLKELNMDIQIGNSQTKVCPLCEKIVDISKFRMHEIGCNRSNYKCKECNMCVPKAERVEHEYEEHGSMTCSHC